MSDDAPIDGEEVIRASSSKSATLLLYDWFKHITTLSLITLAGLLSILQAGDSNVRPGGLAGIVIAIALAGIIGFDGQSRIIKAELSGTPLPKMLDWFRRVAVGSYSIGTGMFLVLFVESVQ